MWFANSPALTSVLVFSLCVAVGWSKLVSVTRKPKGDTFTKTVDCSEANAHDTRQQGKCQCELATTTVAFDLYPACHNVTEMFQETPNARSEAILFMGNNTVNVPTIILDHTKSKWVFDTVPIIRHEDGTAFDVRKCSQQLQLEVEEHTNINEWTNRNAELSNRFRPKLKPQGAISLQLDVSMLNKVTQLEGRVFNLLFPCDKGDVRLYSLFIKFGGSRKYNLSLPSTTTSMTTLSPTTPLPTPKTTTPVDNTIYAESFTVNRASQIGDTYTDSSYTIKCKDNESFIVESLYYDCTNSMELKQNVQGKALWIGSSSGSIFTYTLTPGNDGGETWTPEESEYILLSDSSYLTTTICPAFRIKELLVQGYNGWETWQNYYFNLDQRGEFLVIEFLFPNNRAEFEGQLIVMQIGCGVEVYQLFFKFEGKRLYDSDVAMKPPTTAKPTTTIITTTTITTTRKTPGPSEKTPASVKKDDDNQTVIIGAAIGGAVLVILVIAVLVYCYCRRKEELGASFLQVNTNTTITPFQRSAVSLHPSAPPKVSERDEVLQLAEEIIRQRSQNKPDLVPRYVVPPTRPVNPRPQVGPLSNGGYQAGQADTNQEAYVTLTQARNNNNKGNVEDDYVEMTQPPLYEVLPSEIQSDSTC